MIDPRAVPLLLAFAALAAGRLPAQVGETPAAPATTVALTFDDLPATGRTACDPGA